MSGRHDSAIAREDGGRFLEITPSHFKVQGFFISLGGTQPVSWKDTGKKERPMVVCLAPGRVQKAFGDL